MKMLDERSVLIWGKSGVFSRALERVGAALFSQFVKQGLPSGHGTRLLVVAASLCRARALGSVGSVVEVCAL